MLSRIFKFFIRLKLFFHWIKVERMVKSYINGKDFNLIIYDDSERRLLLPYNKKLFSLNNDFGNNSLEFIFRKTDRGVFVLKAARVNTDGKIYGYQNMQDIAILYHEALGIKKYAITLEDFFIFLPNIKKEERLNLITKDIGIWDVEKFKPLYKHFI